MKRFGKCMLLLVVLSLVLSFGVFAAGEKGGITIIGQVNGAAVVVQDESGTPIPGVADGQNMFYEDGVKLIVTFTGQPANSFKLILAQSAKKDDSSADPGDPTAENIEYINQEDVSGDGTVVFEVYPKLKEDNQSENKRYFVRTVDSTTETTLVDVCTFEYTAPTVSTVKLGDANNDGAVSIRDVQTILRVIAKLDPDLEGNSFIAADVNKDGAISIRDVQSILRVIAKLDPEWT